MDDHTGLEIANAISKLAGVHDRRLGEIGTALGRLADQLTHSNDLTNEPESGIDHLATEIRNGTGNLCASVEELAEVLRPAEED